MEMGWRCLVEGVTPVRQAPRFFLTRCLRSRPVYHDGDASLPVDEKWAATANVRVRLGWAIQTCRELGQERSRWVSLGQAIELAELD